jgi:hypothetical protein
MGLLFLCQIDPLIGRRQGQSAGHFVFRGSVRIVPQIDLTVFSI